MIRGFHIIRGVNQLFIMSSMPPLASKDKSNIKETINPVFGKGNKVVV